MEPRTSKFSTNRRFVCGVSLCEYGVVRRTTPPYEDRLGRPIGPFGDKRTSPSRPAIRKPRGGGRIDGGEMVRRLWNRELPSSRLITDSFVASALAGMASFGERRLHMRAVWVDPLVRLGTNGPPHLGLRPENDVVAELTAARMVRRLWNRELQSSRRITDSFVASALASMASFGERRLHGGSPRFFYINRKDRRGGPFGLYVRGD